MITKASLTMFSRMHAVRQLSLIFSHTPCGVRPYVADTVYMRYENRTIIAITFYCPAIIFPSVVYPCVTAYNCIIDYTTCNTLL